MAEPVLAVDIGGSKIAAALVGAGGELLRTARRVTPHADGEALWGAVCSAVGEVLDGGTVPAAGIACAGPVDAVAGTASPINVRCWQGFPVVTRMRELLGGVPVELAGDGVCMALGEHWAGAAAGSRYVLGMVVSTGVGGGLVLDGRPYGGRTGNAGHIGHVVVEPDGVACSCGGHGCVETVASGPAVTSWAREHGLHCADAADLAALAREGDPVAVAAFARAGHAVGLAIAATAAVCDLDVAVIGGGVAQANELLLAPVRRTLARHAGLSYLAELRVLPATLGTDAGLVGAAALCHTLD